MSIKQEQSTDYESVYGVVSSAFGRADEAELVNKLRHSMAFIPELSLVGWQNNEIVGYILFTKIQIIDELNQTFESLALAPLAVKPEFQRKGVGSQLIEAGFSKAKELGYQSVVVLGHANYYPRFGFLPAYQWNIKASFAVKPEVFMALELTKDSLKNVSGIVKYAPEFGIR
jgi:putative acetyltransferase